jgi:hypothetical protein
VDGICELQLIVNDFGCILMLQCNITVTGNMTLIKEEGIENVVWDMTKLEGGLLDYNLKEGFTTKVIEFKCGEGWANPERKAWNKEGSFAEVFSEGN